MSSLTPMQQNVIRVAKSWIGTPYHTGGRVKGAGVDCLTLLAEVYHEAGVTGRIDIPYYPNDWHLHRSRERYLEGLLAYARETGEPQPGGIALWKFGRCFSHGAIVVEWPLVIHAYVGRECALEDAHKAVWLSWINPEKPRPVMFFNAVRFP